MNVNKNLISFKVTKALITLIKTFKIGTHIDVFVNANCFDFFYMDVKNYTGLVNCLVEYDTSCTSQIKFCVDADSFISSLEQYDLDPVITINTLEGVLYLSEKDKSKFYSLPILKSKYQVLKEHTTSYNGKNACSSIVCDAKQFYSIVKSVVSFDKVNSETIAEVFKTDDGLRLKLLASKVDARFNEMLLSGQGYVHQEINVKTIFPNYMTTLLKGASKYYFYIYADYVYLSYLVDGVSIKLYLPTKSV